MDTNNRLAGDRPGNDPPLPDPALFALDGKRDKLVRNLIGAPVCDILMCDIEPTDRPVTMKTPVSVLCTYSWITSRRPPTILVPGSPAQWMRERESQLPLQPRLPMSFGYKDPNAAHVPLNPWEPVFVAMATMRPNFRFDLPLPLPLPPQPAPALPAQTAPPRKRARLQGGAGAGAGAGSAGAGAGAGYAGAGSAGAGAAAAGAPAAEGTGGIDILINRRTLSVLYDICHGRTVSTFGVRVYLVGNTLVVDTATERPRLPKSTPNDPSRFGVMFEEGFCRWAGDVRRSECHHRVIEYDMGGLRCAVRFEVDAQYTTPDQIPSRLSNEARRELTELRQQDMKVQQQRGPPPSSSSFPSSSRPPSQQSLENATNMSAVRFHPAGNLMPQAQMAELKSLGMKLVSHNLSLGGSGHFPQLWFGRTNTLIMGGHTAGNFIRIKVNHLESSLAEWERRVAVQAGLRRLVGLLRRIRRAVQADTEPGPWVLVWDKLNRRGGFPPEYEEMLAGNTPFMEEEEPVEDGDDNSDLDDDDDDEPELEPEDGKGGDNDEDRMDEDEDEMDADEGGGVLLGQEQAQQAIPAQTMITAGVVQASTSITRTHVGAGKETVQVTSGRTNVIQLTVKAGDRPGTGSRLLYDRALDQRRFRLYRAREKNRTVASPALLDLFWGRKDLEAPLGAGRSGNSVNMKWDDYKRPSGGANGRMGAGGGRGRGGQYHQRGPQRNGWTAGGAM